jgi:hypothetical protein
LLAIIHQVIAEPGNAIVLAKRQCYTAFQAMDEAMVSTMETVVTEGIVFNIQHYSIHDGPSIRTTAFMNG